MQLTKFKGNALKVTADIAPKVEKYVQKFMWGLCGGGGGHKLIPSSLPYKRAISSLVFNKSHSNLASLQILRGCFATEGSILHSLQKLNPKLATSSLGDSRFGVSLF